jgi:hypothetical protein
MPDPPGTEWFKQQTQKIQNPGPAAEIPYGPVQGELNLLPEYKDRQKNPG